MRKIVAMTKDHFRAILNTSTPFAPRDELEANRRIDSERYTRPDDQVDSEEISVDALIDAAISVSLKEPSNPEFTTDVDLPATVFVPAHPAIIDGKKCVEYETRTTSNGRILLPAFSSQEKFIEQLGEFQPGLKTDLNALLNFLEPGDICIDPTFEEDAERWDANRLEQFKVNINQRLKGL